MNRSIGRARILVMSVLLSAPLAALGSLAPPPVSATDPIINPRSLPCAVIVGQPTWLLPAAANDDAYTREGLDMSLPGDEAFVSLTVPAPGVLDNDPGGSDGWFAALYDPPHHAAQFTLNSDGSFTYVPVAGYYGSDFFTYVRYVEGGQCSTGAVVRIAAADHIRARDDHYTAYVNTTLTDEIAICTLVGVCGAMNNDLNINGDTRVVRVWHQEGGFNFYGDPRTISTAHGTATVHANGTFTYTPNADYQGPDFFWYLPWNSATQTYGRSLHCLDSTNQQPCGDDRYFAVVNINVITPPPPTVAQGVPDTVTVNEDETTTISPSTLLANDINSHSIIYLQNSFFPFATHRTEHGTLTVFYSDFIPGFPSKRVSSIQYTPDLNYVGPDSFRYYVASGYNNGWDITDHTGTVAIDVQPVNDKPNAVTDVVTTDFNQPITVNVVANDTDPEGNLAPSTVGRDPDPCNNQPQHVPSCPDSDDGWDLLARGTWVPNGNGTITYTPTPGFDGTGLYPYQVCDTTGLCDQASVAVHISSLGDDAYATNEDTQLTVNAPGVKANDKPGAAATLGETTENGTLSLQADGSFTYTPDDDFNGNDTFTYANGSDTATVTINVAAVNDQPDLFVNDWCDLSIPFIICPTADDRFGDEGDTFVLNGSLKDVEFNSGTLVVDWGDGTTTTAAYPCLGQAGCPFTLNPTYSSICVGTGCADLYFRLHHTYTDDLAGASDFIPITATITEGDGTQDQFATGGKVRNVAPDLTISPEDCGAICIGSFSNLIVAAGQEAWIEGKVADPGRDTGTITIDWGDGSTPSTVNIGCGSPSSVCATPSQQSLGCGFPGTFGPNCGYFHAPHTYASGGSYTVAVTAADDDGGSDAATAQATVSAPDTEDPTISASATAGGQAYTAGTWTNQDVTVHFTCDDDSGVVTCPPDVVVTAEGTTPSVSGTATDGGGQTASASFGPIQIDKTAPVITASATTGSLPYTPGFWTRLPVTVHYTCSDDGGSGVQDCPADQTYPNGTFTASGTATDNAGNTSSTTLGPIQVDTVAPMITASATKADGTSYTADTWTNQSVTVHFSCFDFIGSGVAICPPDATYGTDGVFTATDFSLDIVGNDASTSFGPIKIDKTAPTISATATKADGTAYTPFTWTNQSVTVHFTCDDAGSGVLGFCPPDRTFATNGIFFGAGSVLDRAGNHGSAEVAGILIDKTAPQITASATAGGQPYAAGSWTNQDVVVHYDCSDAGGSGLLFCPADDIFTTSGTATGTALDVARNSASASFGPINIDKTGPTISASATAGGQPYTPGTWTSLDVTVHFTCVDESGAVTCPDDVLVNAEGNTPSVGGTASDGTGNTASASFGPIRIDRTAPTITASATAGGLPYVAGTWTNKDVLVHYTCADSLSGIGTCPADQTFAASGTASGAATDNAGNSASTSFGPITIDKTGPTISFGTTCPAQVVVGASRSVTWTASDDGSGLVGPSTGTIQLPTSSLGVQSVSKTVTDSAGTSSTATCSYQVGYQILGFFSPVPNSKWKPGQTVSIKIALANAAGTQLQACSQCSVTFEAQKVASPSGGPATGQATGPTAMKYDPKNKQYVYNWKVGPARQGTGLTSLLVTVRYADGTTSTLSQTIIISN